MPKHDTCRQQFDPAVPTEREERWTVRPPCADTGNNQFQKHPENCEPLNRADAVQGVSLQRRIPVAYSEGFRLRWDQVDWERRLIRFGSDVKTPGSSEPLPLTDLAYQVLLKWKEGLGSDSP